MDKFAKARNARAKKDLPRGRESLRNTERLHYKFIVKYVEGLYPEIHQKAEKLFQQTRKLNPNVSDLTKTAIFMKTVTPDLPVPKYYYRRKGQQQMVLKIHMLDNEQLSSAMAQPQTQIVPEHTVPTETTPQPQTQIVHEHTVPTETMPQPQTQIVPEQIIPPEHTPDESLCQHPLLIQPEIYNEILLEIQRDPEMRQIFDTITTNDDISMADQGGEIAQHTEDDNGMNEQIWNNICPSDGTMLLEKIVEGY